LLFVRCRDFLHQVAVLLMLGTISSSSLPAFSAKSTLPLATSPISYAATRLHSRSADWSGRRYVDVTILSAMLFMATTVCPTAWPPSLASLAHEADERKWLPDTVY
jgi:hypothetical protein